MPRPAPGLVNTSARYSTSFDGQALTPRTPHSRSGRAEEAFTEIELDQLNEDDDHVDHQPSVPLLSSSRTSDGYRGRGDAYGPERRFRGLSSVLSRLPLLLGSLLALLLLALIILSWKRPETLQKIVGSPDLASSSSVSEPSVNKPSPIPTKPSTHSDIHQLSYENYTHFPLLPSEYRAECAKLNQGYMSHGDYWEPHEMGVLDVSHHDEMTDYHLPEGEMTAVCKSTITYMLDGEVGLLADIALMAQVAALARERNRTFLVDDTYWNRGKWTDHFQDVRARQPGPEPGCRAPPPEELVACPRLARHWVINSRTAKYHLGHGFMNKYEDPYGKRLNRMKPIFDAAAVSLKETIRPNAHNARLIRSARVELAELAAQPDGFKEANATYIAAHVRRGDRKPSFSHYQQKYIPLSEFVEAITGTWSRLNPVLNTEEIPPPATLFLASDSPEAQSALAVRFPDYVTFTLAESRDEELRSLVSPVEYVQKEFNALDEEVRVNATRGMIVDFALLSGMWAWEGEIIPDAVVCTISSNVCRLSAVGLGWERAFGPVDETGALVDQDLRWVDVDQKGQITPEWEAFELF